MADPNYDPQKAHEDYLRRRELHPRQPGETPDPAQGNAKQTPPPKTATQLRQETEVRVLKLQAKLKKLKVLLDQMLKEAKARSGITTPAKSDTPTEKEAKPLSEKDKAEAAKRSKEYYDKKKKAEDPSTQEQSVKDEIAKVQAKIQKIRDELKASIQGARDQVSRIS
jgi:hypothetical protein